MTSNASKTFEQTRPVALSLILIKDNFDLSQYCFILSLVLVITPTQNLILQFIATVAITLVLTLIPCSMWEYLRQGNQLSLVTYLQLRWPALPVNWNQNGLSPPRITSGPRSWAWKLVDLQETSQWQAGLGNNTLRLPHYTYLSNFLGKKVLQLV